MYTSGYSTLKCPGEKKKPASAQSRQSSSTRVLLFSFVIGPLLRSRVRLVPVGEVGATVVVRRLLMLMLLEVFELLLLHVAVTRM